MPGYIISVIDTNRIDPSKAGFERLGSNQPTYLEGVDYEVVSGYLLYLYRKSGLEPIYQEFDNGNAEEPDFAIFPYIQRRIALMYRKGNVFYAEEMIFNRESRHLIGPKEDVLEEIRYINELSRGQSVRDLVTIEKIWPSLTL